MRCEPPGAVVVVDGTAAGRTPLRLTAAEGNHAIEVRGEAAYLRPHKAYLALRRGVVEKLDVKLSPALRLGAGVWLGEDLPAVDRRAVVHPLTHLEPVVPRSLGRVVQRPVVASLPQTWGPPRARAFRSSDAKMHLAT